MESSPCIRCIMFDDLAHRILFCLCHKTHRKLLSDAVIGSIFSFSLVVTVSTSSSHALRIIHPE